MRVTNRDLLLINQLLRHFSDQPVTNQTAEWQDGLAILKSKMLAEKRESQARQERLSQIEKSSVPVIDNSKFPIHALLNQSPVNLTAEKQSQLPQRDPSNESDA